MKKIKNEWTGYGPCDNEYIYAELSKIKKTKISVFNIVFTELLSQCEDEMELFTKLNIEECSKRNLLLAVIDFFSHNNPSIFKSLSHSEMNFVFKAIDSLIPLCKNWNDPQCRENVILCVKKDFESALSINL